MTEICLETDLDLTKMHGGATVRLATTISETVGSDEDIDSEPTTESLVKESKKFINMSGDRYLFAG